MPLTMVNLFTVMNGPIDTLVRQEFEDVDDNGNRMIRHLGDGAYLTSRVDQRGRLLRQELLLGEDFLVWQHGTRLRTGLCHRPDEPQRAIYDPSPSRTRIETIRLAIQGYRGKDKYIRHLSRVVVHTSGLGMAGAEVVTVSEEAAALMRLERRRAVEASKRSRQLLFAAGAAAVLGILVWLLRH
jgi:hypothetical protein